MKNRMKKEKKLVCYFILPKSYQRAQCAHPSARQLLQQDQLWAEYATAKAVGRVKVKPTWNNLFMTQQILLAQVGVSSSSLFAGHRTKGSVADVHIPDIPSQPARSGLSERCSDSKDRRCLLGQHDPGTFPGIQMWQWRWEEPHISMGELQRHLNLMPVPSLVPDKPCLCMESENDALISDLYAPQPPSSMVDVSVHKQSLHHTVFFSENSASIFLAAISLWA